MNSLPNENIYEAPFFYDAEKDLIRIEFYTEAVSDNVSGGHYEIKIRPGMDVYGLLFEDLKAAGKGSVTFDDTAKKAWISRVSTLNNPDADKPETQGQ